MKKRLAVTMIAVSLASGFLAFAKGEDKSTAGAPELCPDECCVNGRQECKTTPSCCKDTEMCCE